MQVAKTTKRYDESVSHVDRHRKGRPRFSSAAEDKFISLPASEIAAQINAQVADTSQHQLFRGDCVNQAFVVELLQRNHYQKDTNKKKRLAWAKKHEQWTLDWWKVQM